MQFLINIRGTPVAEHWLSETGFEDYKRAEVSLERAHFMLELLVCVVQRHGISSGSYRDFAGTSGVASYWAARAGTNAMRLGCIKVTVDCTKPRKF
jgi:hypothetical protein